MIPVFGIRSRRSPAKPWSHGGGSAPTVMSEVLIRRTETQNGPKLRTSEQRANRR